MHMHGDNMEHACRYTLVGTVYMYWYWYVSCDYFTVLLSFSRVYNSYMTVIGCMRCMVEYTPITIR